MNKKIIASICILNLGVFSSFGQQIVTFTGYGRAQVDNNQFVVGDSTSDANNAKIKNPKKEVGKSARGYTLFDLGINASPNDNFKASVILRLRNEFGGFFGNGSSFAFRQMRLEGKIAKVVKYEIGDIDLGLSKYTLYNANDMWSDYESDIFKIRRDIVNYENFYIDNKWRLQGLNLGTTLKFTKGIEKINLQAFGTRTKPSNFFSIPDRFLFGGRAEVVQGKFGSLGINNINVQDAEGTALNASSLYSNSNTSVDLKAKADFGPIQAGLEGEFGVSSFTADSLIKKGERKELRNVNDMFYDAQLFVAYKPFGIKLFGGYKLVGVDYYAPGAQTLRVYNQPAINGTNNASINPNYVNGTAGQDVRSINLYDRFTQESIGGLYNNSIQTAFRPYLPQFNNATPYGDATANRKGIYVGLTAKDSAGIYDVSVKYEGIQEISSEGMVDSLQKRKFSVITAGGKININKIFKIQRGIAINGGVRLEDTKRGGQSAVALKNQLIDAGLEFEAFKSFFILAGYKAMSSKGNEFLMGRDKSTNELRAGNDLIAVSTIDLKQSIVSFGAKYNFNKNNVFSAQLNLVDNKGIIYGQQDGLKFVGFSSNRDYKLTQFYFVYTIRF